MSYNALSRLLLTLAIALPAHTSAQETTFGHRVGINPQAHRLMVLADSACLPIVNGVRNDACSIQGRARYYRLATSAEEVSGAASINRDPQDASLLHVNFFTYKCDTAGGADVRLYDESPEGQARPIRPDCQQEVNAINARRYALQFQNRESESFWSSSVHLKVITIPFKVRDGYMSDTVRVPTRAEANVNGNLFVGYRIGREKYFYERGATRNPYTMWHVTPGAFVGGSVVSIGKETTRSAAVPLQETIPTAVLSSGFGVMVGMRNFSLGGFVGWDRAFGDAAKKWDYNKRHFWGIGITLDSFWDTPRL